MNHNSDVWSVGNIETTIGIHNYLRIELSSDRFRPFDVRVLFASGESLLGINAAGLESK